MQDFKINSQKNDEEETMAGILLKNSNEEQTRVDRLKFFRMVKSGDVTLEQIMETPKSQYT